MSTETKQAYAGRFELGPVYGRRAIIRTRGNLALSHSIDGREDFPALVRLIAAAMAMYEALEEVHDFIRFGIELGYIRMPDADPTDAAHDVPEKVRAALAQARGEG